MRALAPALLLLVACPPRGGPDSRGSTCQRLSCAANQCGELGDGCTGVLQCGTCPAGSTCGGGGAANVCGPGTCAPKSCFQQGKNCDRVSDGCSKLIDCGRCLRPSDCGVDGTPNFCGGPSCVKASCANRCGAAGPDDCGGTLDCGACKGEAWDTCGGGGVPFQCGCTPLACAPADAGCGRVDDGCGQQLACGACGAGLACSVGAQPNQCGSCPQANGRVCSAGCWCWETPRLGAHTLSAIWGNGTDDVWFFGFENFYLHKDATGFRSWPGPDTGAIRNAWGSGPDDVWAVAPSPSASRTMVHWDGVGWWPVQLPIGTSLSSVWGFAADDVWAAGASGVYRWDGKTWTQTNAPTDNYTDVWGAAPNDLWAGGTNLHHWNGSSWTGSGPSGATIDLHGSAADDVWAATSTGLFHFANGSWHPQTVDMGAGPFQRVLALGPADVWVARNGTLLHFDGATWSEVPLGDPGSLDGLWAAGPGDVWVSLGARVYHWDGGGWSTPSGIAEHAVRGLHAVSPTEQWAVGIAGHVLRGDGVTWRDLPPVTGKDLYGVSGAGGRVWAVGGAGVVLESRDGGALQPVTSPTAQTLFAVHALSASSAFAVGTAGTVLAYDGSGWAALPAPPLDEGWSVWAGAANDVWVGGPVGAEVAHWNGTAWTLTHVADAGALSVGGLYGEGGELFAATSSGIFHSLDGGAWTRLSPGSFWTVWGSSKSDVWFAGLRGAVSHWDGLSLDAGAVGLPNLMLGIGGAGGKVWVGGTLGALQRYDAPDQVVLQRAENATSDEYLEGVWGTAADDVWAVGQLGTARHFDGARWVTHETGLTQLTAVWSAARDDVWASTKLGLFTHWNGVEWTSTRADGGFTAWNDLWGSASNDIWAVGGFTTAHWNGTTWATLTPPNGTGALRAVFGTARDDVWAVGDSIIHFDGNGWTLSTGLGSFEALTSVWCRSRSDCWVAGYGGGQGRMMQWNGSSWRVTGTAPPSPLVDVWGRGDEVMFFGEDGSAYVAVGSDWVASKISPNGNEPHVWGTDAGLWVVGGRGIQSHP